MDQTALKLYNQGMFSSYLTFVCHETFVSIIEYNGTAITLKGGNLDYSDISTQYLLLSVSLKKQHEKTPDNLLIKSLYQKVSILQEIFKLYENEMNIKFFQAVRKMSGDPTVDSQLERHLEGYVNSINKLLPYLRMYFPLDYRNNDLQEGLMTEHQGINAQHSFNQLNHAKMMNEIRTTEAKFKSKALSDSVENSIEVIGGPINGFVKAATRVVTKIPTGIVRSATATVAEEAKETIVDVLTEGESLLYKLLFSPITWCLLALAFLCSGKIVLPVFSGIFRPIKNVVVFAGGKIVQIVSLPIQYTYNIVRGRGQGRHQGIYRPRQTPQDIQADREQAARDEYAIQLELDRYNVTREEAFARAQEQANRIQWNMDRGRDPRFRGFGRGSKRIRKHRNSKKQKSIKRNKRNK